MGSRIAFADGFLGLAGDKDLILTSPILDKISRLCAIALFLPVLLVEGPARAGSCELPSDYRVDARPEAEGTATRVDLGVLIADITKIDDVAQSIEGDFIFRKTWHDRRLAGLVGCRFHRAQVWFPITDMLNSSQLRRARGEFSADQVRVGEDGLVEYFQRFFGTIATYHQLHNFPFDRHDLQLRIAALQYPAKALKFNIDRRFTRIAELLNIPDWKIEGLEANVLDQQIPEFDTSYSLVYLIISAKRNSSFYIWKVLFPLTLIVLMSFVVFWITPQRFGPQIGLSATSMLTLIAFQFALTTVLPKVSYFTIMDELILGSTVLVFSSLIQATVTSALVIHGRTELALRIDRVCRWLFPLALVSLWMFVLLRA